MLKFYYARPSLYSRPVWLALLEKGVPFEPVAVTMDGSQFEPEFVALNPFSKIPVLVDRGFRVIESQAILDYLEAAYPQVSLLPTTPEAIATVRMVQMVTLNELVPAIVGLLMQKDEQDLEYARARAIATLHFLEQQLGQSPYFGGDRLSLAEVTAGSLVPLLPRLEIALEEFSALKSWSERLLSRPAWQQIWLTEAEFHDFRRRIRVLARLWQQRRRQRTAVFTGAIAPQSPTH